MDESDEGVFEGGIIRARGLFLADAPHFAGSLSELALQRRRRTAADQTSLVHQSDTVGRQAPWVEGYDLADYAGTVHEDGVGALIDTIMASPEQVTLACIGPCPNTRAALVREPRIADRARFVGMYGSVRKGYEGAEDISAEWNVRADVASCRAAFGAPWDVTITPVDTCGIVRLTGEAYRAVRDSADPLARMLIENYRIWGRSNGAQVDAESSVLYDTVAAYLAFSDELLAMERLGIRVTDDGFTVIDDAATQMNCAVEWRDLRAFEDLVVARLTGGAG